MAEQKTDGHGQTQHQRLPQCIVDFRVVNQPAPHEGKTKTAYCGSNTPLSNLTGAVDDDGFTVRGNQVLIFQHFQNTTNGFTRAADDLTNFRRVILICIPSGWVMASGCFASSAASGRYGPSRRGRPVAHFLRRDLQTASHLRRETHQNVRVHPGSADGISYKRFRPLHMRFSPVPEALRS